MKMEAKKIAYSVAELSEVTGLSKSFLRNEIRDGKLKARHVGRRVLILASSADEYLMMQAEWKPAKALA